ncbi:MAG: hypothetical protein GWN58_33495 [Anaerolineae bacterium]|nr:hypothetical protein [Thermoplasmata archaeon]NIV34192.1 hypothetical protein [Anaerolineae bacterium]NIY06042.1 hypothetical protein [Thermoplasmata archaeon]
MKATTPKDVFDCLSENPVKRSEFRYADYTQKDPEGTWRLSPNYCCEGPYGDDQMISTREVSLTVWSTKSLNTATRMLKSEAELADALASCRAELDEACDHPNAREMSGAEARAAGMFVGNCYHNYECPDCGARYGVDTSG